MPNFDFVPFEFGNERLPKRFWDKIAVDRDSNCWIWTAAKYRKGYAVYRLEGANALAHRVAYKAFKGDIPEGMHIDHLCKVRNCVNPAHLDAVTPKENNARSNSLSAVNARKTNCPKCGSEFTDGRRNRYCKPCLRKWYQDRWTRYKTEGKKYVTFCRKTRRSAGERGQKSITGQMPRHGASTHATGATACGKLPRTNRNLPHYWSRVTRDQICTPSHMQPRIGMSNAANCEISDSQK